MNCPQMLCQLFCNFHYYLLCFFWIQSLAWRLKPLHDWQCFHNFAALVSKSQCTHGDILLEACTRHENCLSSFPTALNSTVTADKSTSLLTHYFNLNLLVMLSKATAHRPLSSHFYSLNCCNRWVRWWMSCRKKLWLCCAGLCESYCSDEMRPSCLVWLQRHHAWT